MQNQTLKPYLFAFLARQRGAIGVFYPIQRILALPEGEQNNMLEIVTRCADLEIQGIELCCEMAHGQTHPAPEGPTIAYELINDVANGPFSLGFMRVSDFGDGPFSKVKELIRSTYRPLLVAWTRNQLEEYVKHNALKVIQ
jgi:hypothetical protein